MRDFGKAWLIGLFGMIVGCASDPAPSSPCVSGVSQACTCTDGRTGAQVCNGSGFDACVCTGGDSGADAPVDAATETGLPETDVTDSGAPDTSAPDTGAPDTGAPDTSDGGVDPGCSGIADTATDVYVDGAAAAGGKGGKTCPFNTIQAALTAPLKAGIKRTIWIGAGEYAEAGLDLLTNVTLHGAGKGKTVIKAMATCPETYSGGTADRCVVYARASSGLSDLTLVGTVPGLGGDSLVGAKGAALSLTNVEITGGNTGFVCRGPVDAVNLTMHGGGNRGIVATGGGILRIRAVAPGESLFDGFATYPAIKVSERVDLRLDGASFQKNGGPAVDINTDETTEPRSHEILSSLFQGNCATVSPCDTVKVYGGSLKVRGSTFRANKATGLTFGVTAEDKLDLGTSVDNGKNVFGGATTKDNNCVGVEVRGAGGSGSIPAVGNAWSMCPPAQATSASCASPSDIAYSGSGSAPLSTGSCTVGP